MAAEPADIAKFTTDGVVLTSPLDPNVSAAIKAAHIDAKDGSAQEIEMFYTNAADAQWALNQIFALKSVVDPLQVGLEVEEALGLGSTIPIAPNTPCFTLVDPVAGLSIILRTRSYALECGTDRFAIELNQ